MSLSITVGNVIYREFGATVNCFIYDPKERREVPIFAYGKGGNKEGTYEGLTVNYGPRTDARAGIHRDRGGSWSTMTVDCTSPLLVKMQVKFTGRGGGGTATFYANTREGGAVNQAVFKKVPVVTDGAISRTSIDILVGQFERIDIDEAIQTYRLSIPPIFIVNAREGIVKSMIEFTELVPAKKLVKKQEIKPIMMANGQQKKVMKRNRPTVNILTKK